MESLSACVDMYSNTAAEKSACYQIFDDLRLEHESATNTSCDDFTTPAEPRCVLFQNANAVGRRKCFAFCLFILHHCALVSLVDRPTTSSQKNQDTTTTVASVAATTSSATQRVDVTYFQVSPFWKVHVSCAEKALEFVQGEMENIF